ncbi:hypothetical protein AAFF_G00137740 [Aldrovandia affinis]|uniref:Uncharacterized protein n=1 Tax=Aldrovandia affinis TaxID=143900 RepID=A0AAD7X2N5_9TELE|nr:hypothetical protein AAFF_G00137740 [Aldrovandia affinis]
MEGRDGSATWQSAETHAVQSSHRSVKQLVNFSEQSGATGMQEQGQRQAKGAQHGGFAAKQGGGGAQTLIPESDLAHKSDMVSTDEVNTSSSAGDIETETGEKQRTRSEPIALIPGPDLAGQRSGVTTVGVVDGKVQEAGITALACEEKQIVLEVKESTAIPTITVPKESAQHRSQEHSERQTDMKQKRVPSPSSLRLERQSVSSGPASGEFPDADMASPLHKDMGCPAAGKASPPLPTETEGGVQRENAGSTAGSQGFILPSVGDPGRYMTQPLQAEESATGRSTVSLEPISSLSAPLSDGSVAVKKTGGDAPKVSAGNDLDIFPRAISGELESSDWRAHGTQSDPTPSNVTKTPESQQGRKKESETCVLTEAAILEKVEEKPKRENKMWRRLLEKKP